MSYYYMILRDNNGKWMREYSIRCRYRVGCSQRGSLSAPFTLLLRSHSQGTSRHLPGAMHFPLSYFFLSLRSGRNRASLTPLVRSANDEAKCCLVSRLGLIVLRVSMTNVIQRLRTQLYRLPYAEGQALTTRSLTRPTQKTKRDSELGSNARQRARAAYRGPANQRTRLSHHSVKYFQSASPMKSVYVLLNVQAGTSLRRVRTVLIARTYLPLAMARKCNDVQLILPLHPWPAK